jgi:hypothetical protein
VVVQQAQDSMVLNPSDASGSSVNMVHQATLALEHNDQHMGIMPVADLFNLNLHVGAMQFGPKLPPDLLWKQFFERVLPEILAKVCHLSCLLKGHGILLLTWVRNSISIHSLLSPAAGQ